jgi:hypothetical protein
MKINLQHGAQIAHRHAGSFLFVVSHMRSFSSLLCHILGSHPEISGYAEMHLSYLGRPDLDRLARKVREITDNAPLRRYVLDKLLHNYRQIMPRVFERPDVKVVFLLRNAEDTLKSILNVVHALGGTNELSDPERALEYYATRLQHMQEYSSALGGRALFIEAESLIEGTDVVLARLTQGLGLGSPLSAEYRTFQHTGETGYGDPSANIQRGSVVSDAEERHRDYVPLALPPDVIRRGIAFHAACRDVLARNAGGV